MTTETNNNMIKNNENLVFVNCRKGDKITKIKPAQELTKNRGYRKTFSQQFIVHTKSKCLLSKKKLIILNCYIGNLKNKRKILPNHWWTKNEPSTAGHNYRHFPDNELAIIVDGLLILKKPG